MVSLQTPPTQMFGELTFYCSGAFDMITWRC